MREYFEVLRGSRGLFVCTVIANICNLVAVAAATAVSSVIVGRAVTGADPDLGRWGWILAFCVVASGLSTWWEMYVAHDLAYRVLAELRSTLFRHLTRILPSRKLARNSSDTVTTAVGDIEQLEWFFAHIIAQLIGVSVATLSGLIVLGLMVPGVILIMLLGIVAILLVPWAVHRWSRRQASEQREELGALGTDIVDLVDGLPDLIHAGALDHALHDVNQHTAQLSGQRIRSAVREGVETALSTTIISVISIGSLILVSLSDVDRAFAPVVLGLCGATLSAPALLSSVLIHAGAVREASDRVLSVLRTAPEVSDPAEPAALGEGGLEFRDVSFEWEEGTPVLQGLSFQVEAGEILALVGPSGVGKSTVVALTQRFYDPAHGEVRLAGNNLRDYTEDQLRELVCVVPQEVQTFAGTVADNLRLSRPDASDADMTAALEAVGLGDFPLDRVLWSRTKGLSGGQRTRLGVARALLREPRILVLDETSAHLDTATEASLLDLVRRQVAQHKMGVLLVTHRESTKAIADRVVELHPVR